PGRVRARDVGLPRVLHPGSGRVRHREPRASRSLARPLATAGARCPSRAGPGRRLALSVDRCRAHRLDAEARCRSRNSGLAEPSALALLVDGFPGATIGHVWSRVLNRRHVRLVFRAEARLVLPDEYATDLLPEPHGWSLRARQWRVFAPVSG